MRKTKTIILIVSLVLAVGLLAGGLIRNNVSSSSSASRVSRPSSPASTTPASTPETSPAETSAPVAKILLLVEVDDDIDIIVTENGVELDPIDTVHYGYVPEEEESKGGSYSRYGIECYCYLVDPTCTTFDYTRSSKSDPTVICTVFYSYFSDSSGSWVFDSMDCTHKYFPFELDAGNSFVFVSFGNVIETEVEG